ncbi:MAG: glycosyltransferase family 2 protein [Burkholderiales bacterium]|nr:glycosyltransferase family 2 protein [Burkholderiales bacterium]
MKISIIIPTHNRPELLHAALMGVAAQNYQDLEIIVVDDHSSPDQQVLNARITASIGVRCKYINLITDRPQAGGPSSTRNVGIQAASGDLIGFCDDDDYWHDVQHLAVVADAFTKDSKLDLLYANQETFFQGKPVKPFWQPHLIERLGIVSTESGRVIHLSKIDSLSVSGSFGHLNTCIFRRELLRSLGGFWCSQKYSEDLDLFVRAIDAARHIAYLDLTVSVHNRPDRTRRDNVSSRLDEQAKSITLLNIVNHLMDTCSTPAALRFARLLGANECRDLALSLSRQREHAKAWIWARQGLAWHFTLKWMGYVMAKGLMQILRTFRPSSVVESGK